MIGYRKWCGIEVNVGAFCATHVKNGEQMTATILQGHSAGFAEAYNREVQP